MDCKNLMVGDWVSYCGFYNKVIYIGQKVSMYNGKGTEFTTDPEYIRPIPLTEEILVKNGFMKDGNGDYEINDGIVVVMDWKGNSEHFACAPYEVENCFGQYYYLYVELFECKYVHQLQHLLRLAGIEKEITL